MEHAQYDWLPTTCAPTNYPARILKGVLRLSDGTEIRLPDDAYLGNGWGNEGSVMLAGAQVKELPDSLNIIWVSFRERRFYKGSFDLSPLRLEERFKAGFTSPVNGRHTTYHYIIVGTAPGGGGISIWLSGDGYTKEAGFLRAAETTVDMESLLGAAPGLEAYVKLSIGDALAAEETTTVNMSMPDAAKWSGLYRKTFSWHPEIITTAPMQSIGIYYFNGERLFWNDLTHIAVSTHQPVPRQCAVHWKDKAGKANISEVSFDEAEIFTAYRRLSAMAADNDLALQIEVNQLSYAARAFLHDKTHIIELKKCSYKTR